MGTVCPSFVRGRRMRVTRLDSGGRPVYGPCNMVTSSGFIQVEMSAETEDGEEINQTNAAGEACVTEAPCPQLKWRNVSIDFCQVDPDLVTILNPTWRKELDDVGNVVGWRGTNRLTCDTGYALEVWTDIGKNSGNLDLLRGGQGRWGYLLLPFVVGGVPGDFTVQNDALTMQFSGKAQAGSSWGKGPYQVIMSNGLPSRLMTPIASDEDHLMRVVTLAPPAAQCGCQEVVRPIPDPATISIEGVATESPRRTVRLRVDNHGFGPVLVTWGDGSPDQTVQDGALVEHQYPEPPEDGQDTYTLTVRDKQTPTVLVQRDITIPLPPDNPTVTVAVDETDTTRRTVLVDWDNHGNGPVTIDWGDLTDPETLADSGTGRKHAYEQDGYYTITVTDVDQPSHLTRVQLSIPVPATPTVSDPTADPADPSGRTAVMNVDNGGRGPTMIEWGDGKSEIGPSDASDVKHQYPAGGKEYTIKVYPQGNPVASVTKTYAVPAVGPVAPTNAATAAEPTTAGVDVTYEHDGTNVTGFRLERAEGASGGTFAEVASTSTASDRQLTDPGPLTAGTTYRWRVIALNDTAESPPSNEASGTVPAVGPVAPTNAATAAEPTTAGVDVTYEHDGTNVTGFRLERAEGASGGTFAEVASTSTASDRQLTDPGPLTAGTTYRWRVIALNDTAESPPSNEASGTVPTALASGSQTKRKK
ncbi:fibronectin type III domain-containing protein [Streptomyces sp. TR02-1]|uniref:fibronectin type III domain-containing protein n=1 Tax=Streptomyces sp. TR02-1 TaxID=3385977 RepID=UPI0039A1D26C